MTRSTGKAGQQQALDEAKRVNKRLSELNVEIDRGHVQPKYLAGAHITKAERVKGGRLIIDAVTDAASAVPSDDTARYTNNYGEHFARYATSSVLYLHQVTEDLLLGFAAA